jgi:acetylglutamate kinase
MQQSEIVLHLSNLTTNPSEVIYAITMQDILTAIARRMGEEALTLTSEDLQLAREEVEVAINHHLDIREYIDMGLDVWEITRKL